MPRVLIVEDERILATNFSEKLEADGHQTTVAPTAQQAMAVCGRLMPDVIVLDVRLPDEDGIALLPRLKAEVPTASVVVVTAHGNERIAVAAIKAGAFEYLTKPVDLDELQLVVNRAIEQQQVSDNLNFLRRQEQETSDLGRIVGDAPATRRFREAIVRLSRPEILGVPNPPTVLITGETGTGKDLAARAIHYQGPRSQRPFIRVNCTVLPTTLIESELFGHVRGAFTSAAQSKRGLFEVADHGTLFLDEIGLLPMDMQVKLLEVIEERVIRPVGGTHPRSIDVHIIAATNHDLEAAVEAGTFRRDLYYRLRVVTISLPPLRERIEDIPRLCDHFLEAYCRRFAMPVKRLSDDAVRALGASQWRGNIRELKHALENAVLQVDGPTIEATDLRVHLKAPEGEDLRLSLPEDRVIRLDFDNETHTLDEFEGMIVMAAYLYTGRNLSRTARLLGISREVLRHRLSKMKESSYRES